MLIRFTVENYLSFKDETEFSMIPGKGTDRKRHIIKSEKRTQFPLLCSGIIYGANASGKSNLIKAISEAKEIILNPLSAGKMLPDFRFKLNEKSKNGRTKFEFEIKANGKYYAYGFSFSPNQIEEEWLYIIKNNNAEIPVFERKQNSVKLNKTVIKNSKEFERFNFMAEDLFPNQLFISIVNSRNTSLMKFSQSFIDVYHWFDNSLAVVFPDSIYRGEPILGGDNKISDFFDFLLNGFGTGIVKTEFKKIPLDQLPESIITDIKSKIQPNGIHILVNNKNDLFKFSMNKTGLKVEELVAYHNNNKDAPFEMSEESDGTNRLIDILPLILNLHTKENKVIFIDEIDRSLHTELTYKFMDLFLEFAENNKAQIIATTHDTSLLDLKLFRKDEIWFIEKDKKGSSKIYSLDQFEPRADLNIRKGYLNGRFGAIPFLGKSLDSFIESYKEAN